MYRDIFESVYIEINLFLRYSKSYIMSRHNIAFFYVRDLHNWNIEAFQPIALRYELLTYKWVCCSNLFNKQY